MKIYKISDPEFNEYGRILDGYPFNINEHGYRVICVLPRGTNMPKGEIEIKSAEDEKDVMIKRN